MTRFLPIVLLCLFVVAVFKMAMSGEWAGVTGAIGMVLFARKDLQALIEDETDDES